MYSIIFQPRKSRNTIIYIIIIIIIIINVAIIIS